MARRKTGLSPPVKYFTDRSKAVLLLWIFYVFCSVLCLLCLCARLFVCALWSPAGKGLASWLSFVVSNCEFVTAGYWDCVAAIERLPALHYSVDFIFLSFGIMGFIVKL